MKMYDHFARPKPVDGKTPTHGEQVCRNAGCGEPIYRAGAQMNSDGVRGNWRHKS